MSALMAWRLHKLCKMLRRYPHEVVPTITVEESVNVALLGEAIERELRKRPNTGIR